ncbi:MAG: Tfp pilus assembly protein FimT/FimU [Candidatus Scatovivens sp.]
MKKQNGISLVALIITIIVMVILAGIIIVSAVADGGVIDRAQGAVKENERANVQEIITSSYVFKENASQNNVYVYLDLGKTGISIYKNLTSNGFTVINAEKTTDENGNIVNTVKVDEENKKIDVNVEGKYGNYTGTVKEKGLEEDVEIVSKENNNIDDENTGNIGDTGNTSDTVGNPEETTGEPSDTTEDVENNGLVFGKFYNYQDDVKFMFSKNYDHCILWISTEGYGMWPYEYDESTQNLKISEVGMDAIVSENGETIEQDGMVIQLTEETYPYEKFSFNDNEYYQGVYYNNTEGVQTYIALYIRESGSYDVTTASVGSNKGWANPDLNVCFENLGITRIDNKNLQLNDKTYTLLEEF